MIVSILLGLYYGMEARLDRWWYRKTIAYTSTHHKPCISTTVSS